MLNNLSTKQHQTRFFLFSFSKISIYLGSSKCRISKLSSCKCLSIGLQNHITLEGRGWNLIQRSHNHLTILVVITQLFRLGWPGAKTQKMAGCDKAVQVSWWPQEAVCTLHSDVKHIDKDKVNKVFKWLCELAPTGIGLSERISHH